MFDIKFMKQAISEAQKAGGKDECPVGAVIVKDNKIIARGHNLCETTPGAQAHAEMIAIKKAAKKLDSWRLIDCDIYVTLEPCAMCSGAIILSRVKNLYFGAYDYKAGASGSVVNLFEEGLFNHNVNVTGGILEDTCSKLLSDFFKQLRTKKRRTE